MPLLFAVNSGATLQQVDWASVPGLTDHALVALGRHAAKTLRSLDVSMSRGITDAGLGEVVDACPLLQRVVLWNSSQISGSFYLGHKRAAHRPAATDQAPLRIYGRAGDVLAAPDDVTSARDFLLGVSID